MRKPHIGPLIPVTIGEARIEWVTHTRLLGISFDDRLSWVHHLRDLKTNFAYKLNLLKRSSFLSRNALLDLYFKIILPSVLNGLVVWGGCPNTDLLQSLELLHRRAARIIYNLPHDTPTDELYRHSNWNTLTLYYKLRLIKLFHSVSMGKAPAAAQYRVPDFDFHHGCVSSLIRVLLHFHFPFFVAVADHRVVRMFRLSLDLWEFSP